MKKIIVNGVLFLSILFLSSCLKSNLEDLPAFEEANITDVKFDFRFKDMNDISPLDNEPMVKVVSLVVENKKINETEGTIICTLRLPSANASFTEEIRNKVTLSNIVGKFNLSTAAKISPLSGSPVLGQPGDFSVPREYEVIAANGSTKKWTITIIGLDK